MIYARKSAEDTRATSIDTQLNVCKECIKKYPFMELTKTYSEDNKSGMFTDGRTEYLAMLESADKGEIDVIVVMKLDRLARDIGDSATAIRLLNKCGCFLYAGDDISDSTTPAGEFLRNIMLAQNTYHARRVASDVMAAECNNVKNGKSAGGVAPYGFKYIDKRYFVNDDEAPAVRIMFEDIAAGKSYKDVINRLTGLRV